MPLVVADGAALSPNSASSSTSEQLTSRMVYQYYSQRLTSEQHVFMQRAVNECYLRTKPETRPIVDPNHLIYQFSRKFRCYCYPFFPASMKIAPPSCTTLPSAWQRHYFCFVCFHMCTFYFILFSAILFPFWLDCLIVALDVYAVCCLLLAPPPTYIVFTFCL